MKRTILVAAIAALFSGVAFAAGDVSGTDAGSRYQSQTGGMAGQSTDEQMRGGGAATDQKAAPSAETAQSTGKYRGEDVSVLKQRFDQLDKNHDGTISYDEARADPEFARYWNEQHLGKDQKVDMAEFARFESEMQTGVNTFQMGEQGLPATKHQEEVTGQGKQGAPGASRSDQERGGGGSRY